MQSIPTGRGVFPSSPRRGGCDIKKILRSVRIGADGVVAHAPSFGIALFAMLLAIAIDAQPQVTQPPLSISQQGYFFTGGRYSTIKGRQVLTGQLYVEFQIPAKRTHPLPIVMIHGLGQSGTNFTGTPDGREGWAQFFLRQGYAVYVVDQPGRGRSAYDDDAYAILSPPDVENVQRRFIAPERYNLWPQAHL